MMDLSIIIVSYNVKYFLEQCLYSVFKTSETLRYEVIVVDNGSVDGSCQMVRDKFPGIRLISNADNKGFAKANNQGISLTSGRYILLLNPDTVVQEDTFQKCMDFMDSHPEAGSMGVKMIDGKGKFLPESKRALPTPKVAFYKIFGLTALFPRTKRFGRYYLGHTDNTQIQKVEVISGAFMFLRKSALERCGLLDETFFMYGEDIDLSYRLMNAGFQNYYFPLTTIIHYKGESTRKSSLNYIFLFYHAMILFARKHFSKKSVRFFSFLVHTAIYFRAGVSILKRFFAGFINPFMDAVLIYAIYWFVLPLWSKHLFGVNGYYPGKYLYVVVPLYIAAWIVSIYFSGGFERKVKLTDLLKGVISGTILILIIYALLPEHLRFSRALIVMGTGWAVIISIAVRWLLMHLDKNRFKFQWMPVKKRIVLVGSPMENRRVISIINQSNIAYELAGFVANDEGTDHPGYIGNISQIKEIVNINRIEEVIFCAKDITSQMIIRTMLIFSDSDVDFKIASPESLSVIGSNSISTMGELYGVYSSTLSRKLNKQKKRILDIFVSVVFLVISPVLMILVENPWGFLKNIGMTLAGACTWVGYYSTKKIDMELPLLKPGILNPVDVLKYDSISEESADDYNLLYAKDYRISRDVAIILQSFKKLGRNPGNLNRVQ